MQLQSIMQKIDDILPEIEEMQRRVFRSPMQLQSIMQNIDDILPEIEEMQRRGLIEIQILNFKFRLANLI
jgi:peptidoglycan hydrolase CwlO-like protein